MDSQKTGQDKFSFWHYGENTMEPVGPIGIITQQINSTFADEIIRKLRQKRQKYIQEYPSLEKYVGYLRKDYRISIDLKRFKTGEGKAELLDTVRGHDLYIITDVLNDGIYMNRFNQMLSLSPDDHYQDLVRIITSTHGVCNRINVIMPYLYEGRRSERMNRSSMDCAIILRQLFDLGVSNFITFDAHDGRVANAVPRQNFENFPTAYQIIEKILETVPDLALDSDHCMVISPSETSINKAIYYATMMRVPLGTFYRIHEADGSVTRDFLGESIEGKDVLIVDDMINTGNTFLSCANYLKENGAKRVFASASFALFTEGYERMNQAYDFGIIDKIFASNLIRLPRPLFDAPWFEPVDMSGSLAQVIDALNHNASLSTLLNPEKKLNKLLSNYYEKNKLNRKQENI